VLKTTGKKEIREPIASDAAIHAIMKWPTIDFFVPTENNERRKQHAVEGPAEKKARTGRSKTIKNQIGDMSSAEYVQVSDRLDQEVKRLLRDFTNKKPKMDVHGSREGETTVERHVGRNGANRRGAILEGGEEDE